MIDKQPTANGKQVKVTFKLPADVAKKSVYIVGDFNNWDETKQPMKLDKKTGVWSKSINLKPNAEYQFRYLVDENEWRNDEQADRYSSNPYMSENSVVSV